MRQDYTNPVATVDNHFFALISPGTWKQVAKVSAQVNRNNVDAAELELVKSDPQVQKILKLFSGLGLSDARALAAAVRHGAATDLAMKQSEASFFEFVD